TLPDRYRQPYAAIALLGRVRGVRKELLTMPRNKDLKRLVRARMGKTGESYTAARVRILAKSKTAAPIDYSELPSMKDGPLEKKTGRTWEQWVRMLDRDGAAKMAH